jgi:hypothetical protein
MTICISEQPLDIRLKLKPYPYRYASPREAVALKQVVDVAIYPLVQAFNAIDGVATIASCSGHYGVAGYGGNPYVFFLAPVSFAEKLSRLREESPRSRRFRWNLEISFHPDMGLAFTLRGACRLPWTVPIGKHDIERLVQLLHQAAA